MTEYEKLVKEGKMTPMNGLDALVIQSLVEDVLEGRDTMNDELFEALDGVMIEIEYLYDEKKDKLNLLQENMRNYANSKI